MIGYVTAFVAGAGTGAVSTYLLMKDKPYPPELIAKMGTREIIDKYVDMKTDPLTHNDAIIFDARERCLINLTRHETYIVVENANLNKGEPTVAQVITRQDQPILVRPTGATGTVSYWASRAGIFGYGGIAAGAPYEGKTIPVRYKKNDGLTEETTTYIDQTTHSFTEMHTRATDRYFVNLKDAATAAAQAYSGYARDFDALPEAEKQKYRDRVKPEMKAGLEEFIRYHEKFPDVNYSVDGSKAHLEELNNLSDEKKLYIYEQAVKNKTICAYDLERLTQNDKFQALENASGIKIEDSYLHADVDAKKQESSDLNPQIQTEKDKADKDTSTGLSNPLTMIHDHPWVALFAGIGMLAGGSSIGGMLPGWAKGLGAIGAVTLIGLAAKELVEQYGGNIKSMFGKHKTVASGQENGKPTADVNLTQTVEKAETRASGKVEGAEPAILDGGRELVAANDERSAAGALLYLNAVSNPRTKTESPTLTNIPGTRATNLDPALAAQGTGVAV